MKKKGLIISTIVMVLVLVVALSTATFAWFSSTATATIKNISVSTIASEGLQIGVKQKTTVPGTSGYVNGAIFYTNSEFGGDNDGWGSLADFANLQTAMGTIDKATTRVTDANLAYEFKVAETDKVPTLATHAGLTNAAATAVIGGDFTGAAKDAIVFCKYPVGTYLTPTGMNAVTMQPTSYDIAVANGTGTEGTANYLALPIGVRATIDVAAILCSITITPEISGITNAQYKPGMAAAAYILISDGANEVLVKAYPNVVAGGTATTGAERDVVEWKYDFVVAYGAVLNNIGYDLTYTIWIEGTDPECINAAAGSGFSVGIEYKYEEVAFGTPGTTSNFTAAITDYTAPSTNGTAVVTGGNAGTYAVTSISKKM